MTQVWAPLCAVRACGFNAWCSCTTAHGTCKQVTECDLNHFPSARRTCQTVQAQGWLYISFKDQRSLKDLHGPTITWGLSWDVVYGHNFVVHLFLKAWWGTLEKAPSPLRSSLSLPPLLGGALDAEKLLAGLTMDCLPLASNHGFLDFYLCMACTWYHIPYRRYFTPYTI